MVAHTVQPWVSYLGGRRDAASLVQLLTQEQEDPPAKQGSNRKLMAASGTALVLAAMSHWCKPPTSAFCGLLCPSVGGKAPSPDILQVCLFPLPQGCQGSGSPRPSE